MTFQQLQYLLEVSRTGSISSASKKLFLAQSSISASIRNLEDELGFPIFIRTKKGMIPTIQGAHIIEHAARICESYHVMTNSAGSSTKHIQIRISAPNYPPLNDAFIRLVDHHAHDPSVSFSLCTLPSMEAVQKLSNYELDIAVLMNHKARLLSVETLLSSKGLHWQTAATIPAVIQIGSGHRLYHQPKIQLEDLQDDLFVDNPHDPLLHNEFLKGIIRLTSEKTISVESEHIQNELVDKGIAYSIGPVTSKETAEGYLFRSIPLADVDYTLTIVTNPLYESSEAAKKYIAYVTHALAGSV